MAMIQSFRTWSKWVAGPLVFLVGCAQALATERPGSPSESVNRIALTTAAASFPFNRAEAVRRQSHSARTLGVTTSLTIPLNAKVSMKFALIPAGSFVKIARDLGVSGKTTVGKAFYMGIHEVNQEQYEAVSQASPSHFRQVGCPVEGVSWRDATRFCLAVSDLTGRSVRLPTESEWEYCCRAGSSNSFCNGSAVADLKKVGWCSYDGHWGSAQGTAPVCSLQPNAWGIHDMHGNVWEWCSDAFGLIEKGRESISPGADRATVTPEEEPYVGYRVLRGGCWYDEPTECTASRRDWMPPGYSSFGIGFRVVAEIWPDRPPRESRE